MRFITARRWQSYSFKEYFAREETRLLVRERMYSFLLWGMMGSAAMQLMWMRMRHQDEMNRLNTEAALLAGKAQPEEQPVVPEGKFIV
jgi:hypothetical protein